MPRIKEVTVKLNTDVKHTLEWKELSQTIMTLNLSIAQIDLSMTEGSYSIDTLIDTFNFMREGLDQLKDSVINDEVQDVAQLKARMVHESQQLSEKVAATIIAFQFYDRLSQRLQHVSKSLCSLSDIISHEDRTIDEDTWNNFRDKMAQYAAMREEYELYELIFNKGLNGERAIEVMKDRMRERMEARKDLPPEDDIELF